MSAQRGVMEWWPVEKVTTDPPGQYARVIRNRWWIVNADGQVAMYRFGDGSIHPQCNTSRSIAEDLSGTHGGTGAVHLAVAFAPIRIEDYR